MTITQNDVVVITNQTTCFQRSIELPAYEQLYPEIEVSFPGNSSSGPTSECCSNVNKIVRILFSTSQMAFAVALITFGILDYTANSSILYLPLWMILSSIFIFTGSVVIFVKADRPPLTALLSSTSRRIQLCAKVIIFMTGAWCTIGGFICAEATKHQTYVIVVASVAIGFQAVTPVFVA